MRPKFSCVPENGSWDFSKLCRNSGSLSIQRANTSALAGLSWFGLGLAEVGV